MSKKNKTLLVREEVSLFITDNGDPSVGISPYCWKVQAPFTLEEIKDKAVDKESVEFFRDEIAKVYQEFSNYKVTAEYDFETKEDNEI